MSKRSTGRKWRLLTAAQLVDAGAACEQLTTFRKLFGESVRVTEKRALAVADKFDWNWAASKLLSAPAWAEYERVEAPALVEYERVTAPALAEYQRVRAAALAEYERVTAPALARAYIGDRSER